MTALELFRVNCCEEAVALLERLASENPCKPGDELPLELPVMPVGEEVVDFNYAWYTAYNQNLSLRPRMLALGRWLGSLGLLRGALEYRKAGL